MTITLTPYAQELLKHIADGRPPEQALERALETLTELEHPVGEPEKNPGNAVSDGRDHSKLVLDLHLPGQDG